MTVMTCADDVQRIDEDDEVRMLRVYLDAVAQFRVSNLSVVHGHWLIDWWKSVAFPAAWLSPSALLHTHPTNQIAAASTTNKQMAMVNSWHACNKLVQQRSAIRQFPNKVKKQLRSTNGSCCALHLANRHFWSFLAPPLTRTLHCSCCFCCCCGPGLFTSFGLWGG